MNKDIKERFMAQLDNRLNCTLICDNKIAIEIFNYLLNENIVNHTSSEWVLNEYDGKSDEENIKDFCKALNDSLIIIDKIYENNKELYHIEPLYLDDTQLIVANDVVFIQKEIIEGIDFNKIGSEEIKII